MLKELLSDKKYYTILILFLIWSTIWNFNANEMSGILPYYLDFTSFFINKLEFSRPFTMNIYSWPMWGYGLVLLLGSKWFIITSQQMVTFIVLIQLRQRFRRILDFNAFSFLSISLLAAFPWFVFHSSLWPYSISANLMSIGLVYLGAGLDKNNLSNVLKSGFLFGVVLNFRSDYYYLFWIFFVAIFSFSLYQRNWLKIKLICYWKFLILILILPWYFYTQKYTGQGSFVSSNSGHVFFISLGQSPNNPWGITTSDSDSLMYSLVKLKFGENESSLSSRSNKFLMEEFKMRVISDKMAFFDKCVSNLKMLMVNPFYFGNLRNGINLDDENFNQLKTAVRGGDVSKAFSLGIESVNANLIVLGIIYIVGLGIFYMFIWAVIRFLWRFYFIRKTTFLEIVILITIVYQFSINVFSYSLSVYTTNVYLMCLVFISLVLSKGFDANNKMHI